MVNDPVTKMIAEKYLDLIKREKIKTIILGCTHYPVLKEDLSQVLDPDVKLVESGEVLYKQLEELFNSGVIKRSSENTREIRVCITDLTDQFEKLAQKLMYPESIGRLEKVVL